MTEKEFIKELNNLNIEINDQQLKQFQTYYQLLVEWNKVMNLTGITEENQVYLKHFYDSATLVKAVNLKNEKTFCDIGTGAGFPGLVIKILFPELEVTLVDSLQKRIQFLNHVIEKLDLQKISTYHARAEEFSKNHREVYDVVTARAVASLPILVEYCSPLVKKNKYFIPMKANMEEELKESENAFQLLNLKTEDYIEFYLPFENSKRSILKLKKMEITPKKYPRKFNDIKKRPL